MRIMPASKHALAAGPRVYLRRPRPRDAAAFIAGARLSDRLHRGWVQAPTTKASFTAYLRRFAGPKSRDTASASHIGVVVCKFDDDALIGVFNFSEIVRGAFESSYLGYYAFAPHVGQGYMSEGLHLVMALAFVKLKLHRIEANVQPTNRPSVALVRRAGFTREGFSRRYVKIAGRWRDHERWAMLAEDWRRLRRTGR
jgi:ribosomal-protein-alanine N-acetyltransferase